MDDTLQQVGQILVQIVTNLTNPEAWQEILRRDGMFLAALVAVTLIVFTETGLLVGFFLPGDSLLVTVGVVSHLAGWPVEWLVLSLWGAAVCGDSLGYLIGSRAGPRLFQKEKSFFFRKDYLFAAQEFYQRHGGKTIVLAKFVPIIRTFAPVVAGIGRMGYKRFLPYTVVGSAGWIGSMLMLGYTLHLWLEPLLKPVFGEHFKVEKQIDKVIIVVIAVSVLPIVLKAGKGWLAKRKIARTPAAPAPTV